MALFTKHKLQVFKNDKIILEGNRNYSDGLWDVPISTSPPLQSANAIISKNKSKQDLASYYHSCCFSPAISTFTKAIKNGNFHSWPGLQELSLYTFLQKTMATSMGHLDQERQGLQSTKPTISSLPTDIDNDFFPSKLSPPLKTHDCIAK